MRHRQPLLLRRVRRGEAAPVVVGAFCFALVLGGAFLFLRPADSSSAATPLAAIRPANQAEPAPAPALQPVQLAAQQTAPLPPAEPTIEQQVTAHLEAGEFAAAFDLAQAQDDPALRASLLRQVANAQLAAGDFKAAAATLRHIPEEFATDADRQHSLAGGMGADFTQLIDLIQNETGDEEYGPWFDLHGQGGTMSQYDNGVRVDPHGVLAMVSREDRTTHLENLSRSARKADLNTDMAKTSTLRMVSLTRLEAAIAERLAEGKPVVESMRQLAGLTDIRYVFVYPEEREIVIAGPAEGWRYDPAGRAVSIDSNKPVLQLDDLVTLLRTFSDDGMNVFGCSIDPRAENLQALKEFAAHSQANGPLRSGQAARWAGQLADKLGMQDVRIYGVPADSRIASVIVEADYLMKLIGIGKLDGGSSIPDYFTLLAENPSQATGGINGLRWWMTMMYEQVLHSEDRTAFELRGSAVRCQSENEFINEQGERVHTGQADPTNTLFARNFTQNYQQLAQREPVFADMQGVFELALVAALIQHDRLDQQTRWDRGVFRTGGSYVTGSCPVPREVETVVNHRVYNGKDVVVQVAGGVRADMIALLQNPESRQQSAKLGTIAQSHRASDLPAGRWWWDAQ